MTILDLFAGNPDTSFATRWEMATAFYSLLVLLAVLWSIRATCLKRASQRRRASFLASRRSVHASRRPHTPIGRRDAHTKDAA